MATWKYLDWLELLSKGELDHTDTYVIHGYSLAEQRILVNTGRDLMSGTLNDLNNSINVSTLDVYFNSYVYNPDNSMRVLTTASSSLRRELGSTTVIENVRVGGNSYRVFVDSNTRSVLDGYITTFDFEITRDGTTTRYALPARDIGYIIGNYGTGHSTICTLERSSVNVINSGSDGNRLPIELVELFNLAEFTTIPFTIYGYHDRNMRTNVSRVNSKNFKSLEDEERNSSFTFVGLELEFMSDTYRDDSHSRGRYRVFERLFTNRANIDVPKHFDVSTDSSLQDRGYEMVGIPMSLAYIKSKREMFNTIFTHMGQNMMFGGGSTHIHLDRAFVFGQHDQYRDAISYFLDALLWSESMLSSDENYRIVVNNGLTSTVINNYHMVNAIAGRTPNSYCGHDTSLRYSESSHSNWTTVRQNTVEFRTFSVSFSVDDLFNKIDFLINAIIKIKEMIDDDSDEKTIRRTLRVLLNGAYLNKLNIIKDYTTAFGWEYMQESFVYRNHYRRDGALDDLLTKQRARLEAIINDSLTN